MKLDSAESPGFITPLEERREALFPFALKFGRGKRGPERNIGEEKQCRVQT
jgi:hypothetical protein